MGIFRKSVLSLATATALSAGNVSALGLGEIDLKSALNQPFNAEIELVSIAQDELDEMRVSLASANAFQNAGIERPQFLSGLRFNLSQSAAGKPIIRVTSQGAVQEPFLDFLMELTWRNGKILREYTVLIDPPASMPMTTVPTIAAPIVRSTVDPASPATISIATRPPISSVSAPQPATPDQYGPTRRSETLWKIAKDIRPASVSIDQMMLALLKANPKAFSKDNINTLKSGYTLQIPTVNAINSLSRREAGRQVQTQYQEWKQARTPSRPNNTGQIERPIETTANEVDESSTASLQLVVPDEDTLTENTGVSSSEGASGAVGNLNKELVLANEALEAQRLESQDMSKRLSLLEEQIQNMQRLIELKDDELANLQQRTTVAETLPVPVEQATATPVVEAVVENLQKTEAIGFTDKIIGQVKSNPVWWGVGGALLGLLTLLGVRRRRESEAAFQESILQVPLDADTGSQEDYDESSVIIGGSDTSLLSEFAVSNISGGSEGDEADPLAEADVFLAYGRYQQADDLLMSALANDPLNEDLNLKLLEVYQAAENNDGFDNHAQTILNHLSGNRTHALWEKVADMGLTLSPGHPLYLTDDAQSVESSPTELTDNTLDFVPNSGFTPDNNLVEDSAASTSNNESMDFNLDGLDFGGSEDMGDGELASVDEVATKLDLARAYIDMGDPEGARSILDEVVLEGSDVQKIEAQEILVKLAS